MSSSIRPNLLKSISLQARKQSMHEYIRLNFASIERRNVKILPQTTTTSQNPYLLSEQEEKKTLQKHQENKQRLRVPRRPPWKKSMTTAELERQEKAAFLDWRRGLAVWAVCAYVPGSCSLIPLLDSRKKRNFFWHHLSETWRSGGNYGESSRGHIW